MFLLQRLAGFERGRDEVGGEHGKGPKGIGYGFSLVQGRRPYMEDVMYASLSFGEPSTCFFGMFDGHAGKKAALWAKEYLGRNLQMELEAGRFICAIRS